jgi:hypothetical protein
MAALFSGRRQRLAHRLDHSVAGDRDPVLGDVLPQQIAPAQRARRAAQVGKLVEECTTSGVPESEIVQAAPQLQVGQQLPVKPVAVVLTGVDHTCLLPEQPGQRRQLHQLRSGAEHGHDLHGFLSTPRCLHDRRGRHWCARRPKPWARPWWIDWAFSATLTEFA